MTEASNGAAASRAAAGSDAAPAETFDRVGTVSGVAAASDPVAGSGPEITVDRVGPGGGVASDSAFGVALVTLWQRAAVGFAAPVHRSDVAARAAGLVDEIKTGRLLGVAANRARRLIGAGFLRPGRGSGQHTGHLELILVDAEHSRAGLGTQLAGRLLAQATDLGLKRVDVQVPADAGHPGSMSEPGP